MANVYVPTKSFIKDHKTALAISLGVIIIGLIWVITQTRHYKAPVAEWILFIVASIVLLAFSFYYSYRDDNAPVVTGNSTVHQRPAISGGVFILVHFLYALAIWGTAASVRADRIENCIPGDDVRPETKPEAWIDFYEHCPGNNLLLDQPAKDYIIKNKKKPFWIMDKSGYTSDPVQWWIYYSQSPSNPYNLTPGVKDTLLNTGFLVERLLPR